MRKEVEPLKDHPHFCPNAVDVGLLVVKRDAVNADSSCVRLFEVVQASEKGGLS
jgi:hypothetical protein